MKGLSLATADRPEAYLNIGLIHVDQGQLDQAEAAYRAKACCPNPRDLKLI